MYFANRHHYVAISLLALASSCGGGGSSAGHRDTARPATPPATVNAVLAVTARWPASFEATGSVKPRASAQIASRAMGYIREIRVQAGDRVAAGQLLVRIEAKDADAAHRQAEAGLEEAKSALPEAASAIRSAEAQTELARVTLRRMQDLLDKRSVSQQEFDEAAARLRVAEAARDAATARKQQLEARIRQAEQAVASAAVQLGYSDLTAPFTGRVAARKADPGTLAVPGQPILELEQEGAWRLEASVEEARLGSVRPGQTATVRLDALDEPLTGRVVEIVPSVDSATRSFIAKLDLPARSVMRSGLFGRADFPLGARDVLAVPEAAVIRQGEVSSVLVADQDIARVRFIRTGEARGGQVEVLSGLAAGDRIIHPRPAGLNDGAPVRAAAAVVESAR